VLRRLIHGDSRRSRKRAGAAARTIPTERFLLFRSG
jgi:hypothetical protein